MPFEVTALYIPYLLSSFLGDGIWYMGNELFYISPLVCLLMLRTGEPLRFCGWWKLQCCIQALPAMAATWHHWGGQNTAGMCVITLVTIFGISIFNAIRVFKS